MKLVSENKEISVKLLPPEQLRSVLQPTRWKILLELAKNPSYPGEIARKFSLDQQKVYYHFNELQKNGVITEVKQERKRGAIARYVKPSHKGYAVVIDEWNPRKSQQGEIPAFLEDFYSNGMFDALVVTGSSDPHGPHEARARDIHYIGDLCLLLGSFSSGVRPCIRTDTDIKEKELEDNNLILLGGPVINMITARINDELPVRMKIGERWGIYSKASGETYYDNAGLIVKADSAFGKGKKVLVIAGTSRGGTKAAMLALLNKTKKIGEEPVCRVVKGLDKDGDGVIDSVKILE